jgi:hypothetical protein
MTYFKVLCISVFIWVDEGNFSKKSHGKPVSVSQFEPGMF